MMLRRTCLGMCLSAALVACNTAWADQGNNAGAKSSLATEKLLEQVRLQMQRAPVMHGSFSQSRKIKGFKQPLLSSGVFVVAQEKGIVWQVQKPFASMLLVKPDRLQSLQADGALSFELSAEKEPAIQTINAMLFAVMSADIGVLQQHFDMTGNASSAHWRMQLVPRDQMLAQWMQQIELQGKQFIEHVRLVEAQGEVSEIALTNMRPSQTLSAADAQLFH